MKNCRPALRKYSCAYFPVVLQTTYLRVQSPVHNTDPRCYSTYSIRVIYSYSLRSRMQDHRSRGEKVFRAILWPYCPASLSFEKIRSQSCLRGIESWHWESYRKRLCI